MAKDKSVTLNEVDNRIRDALANRLEPMGKKLKPLDPQAGKLGKLGGFVEVPKPKGSSKDSSRLTIHVPCGSEHARLNLGAPSKGPLVDAGLTGQTKSHIHWNVTDTSPTTVSLGGKMTSPGQDGSNKAGRGGFTGYAMVTQGRAYHESAQQYYVYSPSDVIARADKGAEIVVQSDSGKGTFFAGGGATIGTGGALNIVAASGLTPEKPTYGGNVEGKVKGGVDRTASKFAHTAFDQGQTLIGMARASVALAKAKPKLGDGTLISMSTARAVGPLLADAAKTVLFYSSQGSNPHNIGIVSQDSVAMEGNSANVWGTMGAGIGSLVSADVVGGTAGIKAATYCGVWGGGGVSIEGVLDVAISAPAGPIQGDARGDVTFTSKTAGAGLAAPQGTAQLSGNEAYVYGKTHSKFAAPGWGFLATNESVEMGKLASADKSTKEAVGAPGIRITKKGITLMAGADCILGMSTKSQRIAMKFKGKGDVVSKGPLNVDGKKLLLG